MTLKPFTEFVTESKILEAIDYNLSNQLPLSECVFRRESKMFESYFKYLKEHKQSLPSDKLTAFDLELLETNIGEYDLFEGQLVALDLPFVAEEALTEEEKVTLNSPKRGGAKKFYVYVKNDQGKVVKVSFGAPGMDVRFDNKEAREAFAARHECSTKKDRTSAGYWSCNLPRYAKALGLSGGGNFYW